MDKNIAYCGVDCSGCTDFSSGKCPSCRLTERKKRYLYAGEMLSGKED